MMSTGITFPLINPLGQQSKHPSPSLNYSWRLRPLLASLIEHGLRDDRISAVIANDSRNIAN
jgi:hypothetical protein